MKVTSESVNSFSSSIIEYARNLQDAEDLKYRREQGYLIFCGNPIPHF
jgi:hypothetical protein